MLQYNVVLLVYAALRYECMRSQATSVCVVYAALSYWCMRAGAHAAAQHSLYSSARSLDGNGSR